LVATTVAALLVSSCSDTVAPETPVATTVTLDVSNVSFSAFGESMTVQATVRDQAGVVMSGVALSWTSSNPTAATVSNAGVITATDNGAATITVSSGSANASVSVAVQQIAASLTLSRTAWTFNSLADTLRLTGDVLDSGGSAIAGAVVDWASVDTLVATVTSSGLVTALSNGTTTLTAIAGGLVETTVITVDQIAAGIATAADTVSFDALGDTATVLATVTDGGGHDFDDAIVIWASSDPGVVSVSAGGLVTSVGNGSATLTATSGLVVHTVVADVQQIVVSLSVAPDSLVLRDPGDTAPLVPTALDALGMQVEGASVVWTPGDASIANVDASGVVTAISTGTTTVSAQVGAFAVPTSVRVEPELTLVGLVPGGDLLEVASETSLSARVEDLLGSGYGGGRVTWSTQVGSGSIVSEPVAESDPTGHVGAVWMLGTTAGPQKAFASIESRGSTVMVEFAVTGTPGVAVDASLIADSVLLSANGETVFLGPTYFDQYGNPTSSSGLQWDSRDPLVANVAADGLVTGGIAGATWVVASIGQPVDSILVTVEMRGAITITFDDGWRSVYDNAWPYFSQFPALRANVGVYVDATAGLYGGYMWETELDVLHAAGWSMVSHTMGHPAMDTLSAGELDYQLRASQQWLVARGYRGSNVFIAPYHIYGPTEKAATSLYYGAGRGVSHDAFPPNDSLVSWMPSLPFELTGVEAELLPFTDQAGRDSLRTILETTTSQGKFVDVFFHQVMPADTAAFRMTLEVLNDFSDRVLPYHELYPAFARGVF
jgi:uncharacterized protein YjdB/peptidoglycan/xylan/chitin deacetylase (PgdA/CDA1 family)